MSFVCDSLQLGCGVWRSLVIMTIFTQRFSLAIISIVCLCSLEVTATGSSCLDTKPADWCNTKCDNQNKCSRKANCQSRCKQTCGLCGDDIEAPTEVPSSPTWDFISATCTTGYNYASTP